MADDLKLRLDELTDNPTARVPVCLALDTSGSMMGKKIDELNAAVSTFFRVIREDEMASIAAEIAVVTFGEKATKVLDFSGIERQHVPAFKADGYTPMGQAVNMSIDMLEQAKRVYSEMGVDYFQPWLVLMTDGEPTDDITIAVQRCQKMVNNRKLTVFPIAIGKDANLAVLGQFSPRLKPIRIEATELKRFFSWLSKSVNAVSLSNPGDTQSAGLGETAFKKMSVDWETAFSS
jgi:uncharacterized protein YegL